MKSVLKYLSFFTLLLLPVVAQGDIECNDFTTQETCEDISLGGVCMWNSSACVERCPLNQDETGCASYNGCEYDDGDCSPCDSNHWNNNNQNSTTCIQVGAGNYKNNEGSDVLLCPNQTTGGIIETTKEQTYIGTCECTNQNRYLIHSYDGNTHFYYCGVCGLGLPPFLIPDVIGSLYECNCADAHANHVYGSTAASNNGTRSECACAKDANDQSFLNNNGLCMCGTGEGQAPYSSTNNGITTYSCCPGLSTYNSTTGNCVCNVQFAKITRDANNNNKLTECECITGTHSGDSCACGSSQYVTFGNNTNPNVNWGETPQYLSSCTTCPQHSYPESYNYPRFCKCHTTHYQEAPSSTSNPTPTCYQCPTQTQTPLPGSVGPESCRLRDTTHFSISNTHTRYMKLIPQGATILPIYTDPYVQNNNNNQSQYTH